MAIFSRAQPIHKVLDVHSTVLNAQVIAKNAYVTPHGGRVDWSAQNQIAFSQFVSGTTQAEVWTMDGSGNNKVSLTGALGGITHISNDIPAWHPDGIHVVFQSVDQALYDALPGTPTDKAPLVQGGSGVDNNLWVLNTQTNVLTQLTHIAASEATLHPSFSPDGTKLWWAARIMNRGAQGQLIGGAKWFLSLADFDVSSVAISNTRLFQPYGTSLFYETHNWTPDGKHVLFTTSANPTEALAINDGASYAFNIARFIPATQLVEPITATTNVWNEHAHYSPSGRHIIWISSQGYAFTPTPGWQSTLMTDLWICNADGSGKKQLTFYNTPGSADYVANTRVILSDNAWNPTGDKCVMMLTAFNGGTVTTQVVVCTFNKAQ